MEESEGRSEAGQQTKRKRSPSTTSDSGLREETEDDEQPEEAADAEHAEEQLISVGLADDSVLDCPICFEPLSIPVFQCTNGHLICSSCRDRATQKCPFCSRKVGNVRCRAIEKVLEAVKIHCSYKGYGCPREMSYASKRSHQENCPYARFGCPFGDCSFVGTQKRLSLHLNNAHKRSVVRLRFDKVCPFSMKKDKMFIVFREEANGTLFILNNHNKMSVSCIGGSGGDGLAYALVVRGKDSCLRFQSITSRFKNTPTGGCGTVDSPSRDFIEVPSCLFRKDGSLKLELCVWRKDAPSVDITKGALGKPR